MKILKYIISLVLLVAAFTGVAQENKKDFKPSEVLIAMDIIGLGKTLFSDESKMEFRAKVDFHHFYLTGEFGYTKINLTGSNFDYSAEGNFFRVGPQVNLMPYNKDRNSIYFGLMYAQSSFNDKITYNQQDVGWGGQDISYTNDNLTSKWYEANVGINVKILEPLYLGYTVRFKFAKSLNGHDELMPFEIPGYGEADKGSRFGFNYYLIYKLRFRNKPVPKRPEPRTVGADAESNTR